MGDTGHSTSHDSEGQSLHSAECGGVHVGVGGPDPNTSLYSSK